MQCQKKNPGLLKGRGFLKAFEETPYSVRRFHQPRRGLPSPDSPEVPVAASDIEEPLS